jgi:catechol 2,3-dioxygenase-like lactoylglutathione lyase family enzyme
MSLRAAPLLYVFYETASLPHQRELCERILGLRVIENQFYPPHEYHGLVKYDGGQIILSLNLLKEGRFRQDVSDAFITVLSVDDEEAVWEQLRQHGYTTQKPGSLFTDAYGHHYLFRSANTNHHVGPAVQELRLTVNDFDASLAFYRDILDLELLDQADRTARFATGTVDLVIQQGQTAPDGRTARYHTYLIVFYTEDIFEKRDVLVQRGLVRSPRVGSSDIGYTTRFTDPSGHTYCLYKPSEESLTWESGPKVMEIVANSGAGELMLANG